MRPIPRGLLIGLVLLIAGVLGMVVVFHLPPLFYALIAFLVLQLATIVAIRKVA